jgi:phosphoribosylamine--glycine ligase
MRIAILGSGGREHALTYAISKSKKTKKIFCIPGNAGTAKIAENLELDINNFNSISEFVEKENIDLVIVGPENPLVNGIVDYLIKKKIMVFGPKKNSAMLEGSKIFTKKICEKYKIPTANFGIFKSKKFAIDFIENSKMPIVVKADVLAAGKGVYICNHKKDAVDAINEIFDGKFGVAKNILIEEFLDGEEMSFFVISDGKDYKCFQTAQDHKRVGEGDTGKNTGGMGAYCPSKLINEKLEKKILEKIIDPTFNALKEIKEEYVGFLYAGLMIKDNEPFLIEYNVRMGDPECQTILPLLETDFLDLILACMNKELKDFKISWKNEKSMCIVLCAQGYPDRYEKNIIIENLPLIRDDESNFLFHAGTKINQNNIYSAGGRVLNFVNISNNFYHSRENIIKQIKKLDWKKGFFRKDIGHRVIETK